MNISTHLHFQTKSPSHGKSPERRAQEAGAAAQRRLCCCCVAPALGAGICPRDGTRGPGTAPGTDPFTVPSEDPSSTGLAIANDICRERKYFAQLFCFCIMFCSLASCSRVCDTGISTATSHMQGYDFSRGTCRKRRRAVKQQDVVPVWM